MSAISDLLAGLASEVLEAEKRFIEENLKDAQWKPTYLTLHNKTKTLFAQLALPEPALAPGVRP